MKGVLREYQPAARDGASGGAETAHRENGRGDLVRVRVRVEVRVRTRVGVRVRVGG